ncbi:PQQ-binding-like beta-propeller repeat protein [Rudanella paleaurantiibacter]|uniref:PQQ-binding-like beta-propeller repeat protein n=1 Tax=Rudanella paleaurantiibacter TaxID=2614655 RepID=A0A7J5U5V7_9BACT|nr:PQQ-binding-like beta-propeller repeat protein [Rudanella paleaurantiibacter]KAB7733031.1 PQQ-binding-like beta-propeller repeat protein [Rudanella paleaurantiibacter]
MRFRGLSFLICFGWFCTVAVGQPIRFAFVTDTHVGAPETAAEDLRRTVADINALPNIDFVVFTGDVTDFGTEEELTTAKRIMDGLTRKWYIFPGNHDTKWSENGCNRFREVFGAERFAFDFGKYRFIGCGSGPNMRMSPGLVAREDVLWLRAEVEKLRGTDRPVIFMNHYPLDDALANWYLLTDELKKTNVQAALCGHGHANKAMNYEGIPATMGRSNLRAKDAVGGYNLVTIRNDTMTFAVRTPTVGAQAGQTALPWRTIVLENHRFGQASKPYPRPSYAVNEQYPQVQAVWEKQDSSDVGAGIVSDGTYAFYPNTNGNLVALSLADGSVKWRFQTGGKVYSTPALHKNRLVFASTDGTIYCLDTRTGRQRWARKTGKAIVASPLIDRKTVYIGSSEGKFRALALKNGAEQWTFDKVNGFIESIPVADKDRVYVGSWGSTLYALNRQTGALDWSWTNGKSRNFSPAAGTPQIVGGRIFLQTPDRTVTALDAQTGREIWKSNKHKGFESSGLSEDGSLVYVKCMNDTLWALSTRSAQLQPEWFVNCRYGYEISPSPVTERGGYIFIPTDDGAVYAVDRQTRQVAWAHKLSNAMVNRIWPLNGREVLVTTMDGKVARLRF